VCCKADVMVWVSVRSSNNNRDSKLNRILIKFTAANVNYFMQYVTTEGSGLRSRYSDSLRFGRSGDRIQVGARFSAPVQTGPGVHPASYTRGTGAVYGGKAAEAWP
jgi:hypothetical protein